MLIRKKLRLLIVSIAKNLMDWEHKLDVVAWTLHVAVEVPVCYKQVEHEAGVRE